MVTARILIADDEELFLDATAELLRQDGHTIDVARDAASAMEQIRSTPYDALIADIKMPGNARLEFVHALEEEAPHLPIILVTGYPSLETAMESVNLNVMAYLTKPIDMETLGQHVDAALARSRTVTLMKRMKDRAQQRIQLVDEVASSPVDDPSSVLEPIFEMAFQDVAEAYIDLRQLFAVMEQDNQESLAVSLQNDPEKQTLFGLIEETIDVLEQTKRSFKSKQLGQLRQRLEETLHDTGRSSQS